MIEKDKNNKPLNEPLSKPLSKPLNHLYEEIFRFEFSYPGMTRLIFTESRLRYGIPEIENEKADLTTKEMIVRGFKTIVGFLDSTNFKKRDYYYPAQRYDWGGRRYYFDKMSDCTLLIENKEIDESTISFNQVKKELCLKDYKILMNELNLNDITINIESDSHLDKGNIGE